MTEDQKIKRTKQLQKMSGKKLKETLAEMDLKKEEIKDFYTDMDLMLEEAAMRAAGSDFHFQDKDGIVYMLTEWKGQFVQQKNWALERTRRKGEKAGGISLIKARELGYEVEGK